MINGDGKIYIYQVSLMITSLSQWFKVLTKAWSELEELHGFSVAQVKVRTKVLTILPWDLNGVQNIVAKTKKPFIF